MTSPGSRSTTYPRTTPTAGTSPGWVSWNPVGSAASWPEASTWSPSCPALTVTATWSWTSSPTPFPRSGEVPDAADYGPEPLVSTMHHGNYVLQALLYQVALHRYLQWRLDGYDPSLHLGGSVYLFVRGMIGPGTPVVAGERCGVTRWSPPARTIIAVSDLFSGHRS